MPAVGALRRRVRLEVRHDAFDAAGGVTAAWVPLAEVFAQVEARSRRERVNDGRPAGLVTHRVTLRWRADVDGRCRVVDGARLYRVLAVEDDDPRRRFLACLCEEDQP